MCSPKLTILSSTELLFDMPWQFLNRFRHHEQDTTHPSFSHGDPAPRLDIHGLEIVDRLQQNASANRPSPDLQAIDEEPNSQSWVMIEKRNTSPNPGSHRFETSHNSAGTPLRHFRHSSSAVPETPCPPLRQHAHMIVPPSNPPLLTQSPERPSRNTNGARK